MKTKVILAFAISISMAVSNSTAQSIKNKIAAKVGKTKSKGKFASFNEINDELGLSGQYFGLVNKGPYGFKFVKEADNKIINELHFYMKPNSVEQKFYLKEGWYRKNGVKLFYYWRNPNADAYDELIEIDEGVLAYVKQSKYTQNDDEPANLEADRTVKDVFAKDPSKLEVYDLETAQAKVEMIINSLNTEKYEKERKNWEKFDIYKNNINKIVFSDNSQYLQKHGYPHKLGVDGKGFKTELDMAGNMLFMAFFEMPPSAKYPGQQITIEYEMNGETANREECRRRSTAWSDAVKILETNDFKYFQSPVRAVREYNSYYGQYVQDYAAMEVLYKNKDKFEVNKTYPLNVKIYSYRDGEKGDLLAEGTVMLKYSENAQKLYEGDPSNPSKKGVWEVYEEFLND